MRADQSRRGLCGSQETVGRARDKLLFEIYKALSQSLLIPSTDVVHSFIPQHTQLGGSEGHHRCRQQTRQMHIATLYMPSCKERQTEERSLRTGLQRRMRRLLMTRLDNGAHDNVAIGGMKRPKNEHVD